jgi:hypothetical protein
MDHVQESAKGLRQIAKLMLKGLLDEFPGKGKSQSIEIARERVADFCRIPPAKNYGDLAYHCGQLAGVARIVSTARKNLAQAQLMIELRGPQPKSSQNHRRRPTL